jgi:hypothetical protein
MKRLIFFVTLLVCTGKINLAAQSETFSIGSYIIDMGSLNQSIGNGLKPYGLVYEMLKSHKVHVKWIIRAGKVKDAKDFTYASKDFRGGTFIIPKEFISPAVLESIIEWEGKGVVGDFTTSLLTLEVTQTLTSVPNWTLNSGNIAIAQKLFVNAGIPTSAYNNTIPSELGSCNDIFVMPHSAPTWSTVGNLYNWNRQYKGAIWSGCHAVSELENLSNPEDTLQKLNFLSTNGLMDFESHKHGSAPFTYFFNRSDYNNEQISARPDDPVFQMIGSEDAAHTNGSEQVYIPKPGSSWRNTTHIGCYDSLQTDVIAGSSNGPAAVTLYGRGHGLNASGLVMYQSGHNLDGTGAANVAAMRQFFNFSFQAMKDKVPAIDGYVYPVNIESGNIYNVSISAKSPVGCSLKYHWTSSCAGSFGDSTSASTIFKPKDVDSNLRYTITCEVIDACSRYSFSTAIMTGVVALPVSLMKFESELIDVNGRLTWSTANEDAVLSYQIYRSLNGADFAHIGSVKPRDGQFMSMEYVFVDRNIRQIQSDKLFYKIKVLEHGQKYFWSHTCYLNLKGIQSDKPITSVFPNPASMQVRVVLKQVPESEYTLSIIDNFGRTIRQYESGALTSGKEIDIDISEFVDGVYLVSLVTKEGFSETCRFIKSQN